MLKHVVLLAMAATVAMAASGTYDCAQGCPLSGVSGVCGANGVTFINDCLAECAGTAVAHQGPCLAPGRAAPGASAAAAASPAALAASPVGAFLSGAAAPGALAAAGGDVRVASLADMRRFEQEGLVLAGPARLADFQVSKPAASPNGGVRAASVGPGGVTPLFTVRVLPKEGLVYVSSAPFDAAATPAAAATPSSRPDRAAAAAARTAASAARAAAAAAAPLAAPAADVSAAAAAAQPAQPAAARAAGKKSHLDAPGWVEIQTLSPFPYSAVGWLNLGYDGGSGMCSGSLVGKYVVVTAAHCVYDRGSGSSLTTANFAPHNYYTPKLQLVRPFGSIDAYAFDFISGWKNEANIDQAWISDMAVILLNKDAGTASGTLGYAYNASGYSGQIYLAGYPGETPRVAGEFFKLKGKCVIDDTDGTDAQMDMKTPTQDTCLTACAIAERGQSGQPAFVESGANWVVRGVLSHGPPTGECRGYDTYTEVDAMHYKFLDQHRMWTPPKAPGA